MFEVSCFFFSSRRRQTRCALVTGVQTCALPILPRAAIERIAEADGFACLAEDRRQGLWKVRGLGEAPLPLFAAADAREASFSPEGLEPETRLRPMTEGREVIEDYRTLQLSLRDRKSTRLNSSH